MSAWPRRVVAAAVLSCVLLRVYVHRSGTRTPCDVLQSQLRLDPTAPSLLDAATVVHGAAHRTRELNATDHLYAASAHAIITDLERARDAVTDELRWRRDANLPLVVPASALLVCERFPEVALLRVAWADVRSGAFAVVRTVYDALRIAHVAPTTRSFAHAFWVSLYAAAPCFVLAFQPLLRTLLTAALFALAALAARATHLLTTGSWALPDDYAAPVALHRFVAHEPASAAAFALEAVSGTRTALFEQAVQLARAEQSARNANSGSASADADTDAGTEASPPPAPAVVAVPSVGYGEEFAPDPSAPEDSVSRALFGSPAADDTTTRERGGPGYPAAGDSDDADAVPPAMGVGPAPDLLPSGGTTSDGGVLGAVLASREAAADEEMRRVGDENDDDPPSSPGPDAFVSPPSLPLDASSELRARPVRSIPSPQSPSLPRRSLLVPVRPGAGAAGSNHSASSGARARSAPWRTQRWAARRVPVGSGALFEEAATRHRVNAISRVAVWVVFAVALHALQQGAASVGLGGSVVVGRGWVVAVVVFVFVFEDGVVQLLTRAWRPEPFALFVTACGFCGIPPHPALLLLASVQYAELSHEPLDGSAFGACAAAGLLLGHTLWPSGLPAPMPLFSTRVTRLAWWALHVAALQWTAYAVVRVGRDRVPVLSCTVAGAVAVAATLWCSLLLSSESVRLEGDTALCLLTGAIELALRVALWAYWRWQRRRDPFHPSKRDALVPAPGAVTRALLLFTVCVAALDADTLWSAYVARPDSVVMRVLRTAATAAAASARP